MIFRGKKRRNFPPHKTVLLMIKLCKHLDSSWTIFFPLFFFQSTFTFLGLSPTLVHLCKSNMILNVWKLLSYHQTKMKKPFSYVLSFWKMVFCYENCSSLLLEKIVLGIRNNFCKIEEDVLEFADFLRSLD